MIDQYYMAILSLVSWDIIPDWQAILTAPAIFLALSFEKILLRCVFTVSELR